MSKLANSDINILVVDDEEVVLSLVRDSLEEDGFVVRTASDAFEALESIEERAVELLITDIRMPRMDGIELVQKVRKSYPNIAVIFTTGYANLNSAKDALRQGASDYILKPFELKEMRQAVHNAVEKIKREADSRESDTQLDRLSDLHHMLFTVGDKKTLITISLRFAMMHCNSSHGSVLYWNSNTADVRVLSVSGEDIAETELPERVWLEGVNHLEPEHVHQPMVVSSLSEHPLFRHLADQNLEHNILPSLEQDGRLALVTPVCRGSSVYGVLIICVDSNSARVEDSSLRFLTFTTHQLAMSLENLEFLEEAQNAYTRLKELQDETIQLEKMATRGEMSAEIGHELNNFLGVVAGNLSLLDHQLKKKNYDELERYVSVMADNIGKIKNFTANLMDLRPISTTKEIVYFDKLIKEVIDYLKPQRRFRQVTINLVAISEPLPFEADTVHIQQVLYNLFNNAADAMMDCERREITLNAAPNEDRTSFRVTITDTGVGIQPENLRRVFHEKFTTKEKGHGFGLVVCKRIIESHHGKISIDSAPGMGTSISIDFPLHLHPVEVASAI
ncbi:MAG: response regulator [Candidatus Zixiibacteriota bacterium]